MLLNWFLFLLLISLNYRHVLVKNLEEERENHFSYPTPCLRQMLWFWVSFHPLELSNINFLCASTCIWIVVTEVSLVSNHDHVKMTINIQYTSLLRVIPVWHKIIFYNLLSWATTSCVTSDYLQGLPQNVPQFFQECVRKGPMYGKFWLPSCSQVISDVNCKTAFQ